MPILEFVTGLVRHAMTFGGGYVIAAGVGDADEVSSLTGAAVTAIGIVWSWFRKWKRAQDAA